MLALSPVSLARPEGSGETRSRYVDIPDRPGQPLTVTAASEDVLDNAVWHALRTRHSALAEGAGRARRYPPELSVFGGVDVLDADGWAALGDLLGPGGGTVLFRREVPPLPPHIRMEQAQHMAQALVKGDPHRGRIIKEAVKGKVEEFINR